MAAPSPLDNFSSNRLPRWMWIVLAVMFLTAVGLAMAMPYLQKLSAESGDGHVFTQAARVRTFTEAYSAKQGYYPLTGPTFKATALPEGDLPNVRMVISRDEIPQVFHKDLFESWLPIFEKDKYQVLFVSQSLSGDTTSLWILKSDSPKPLKLLEHAASPE